MRGFNNFENGSGCARKFRHRCNNRNGTGRGMYNSEENSHCLINNLDFFQNNDEKIKFLESKEVIFHAKLDFITNEIEKLKCQGPVNSDV